MLLIRNFTMLLIKCSFGSFNQCNSATTLALLQPVKPAVSLLEKLRLIVIIIVLC